MLTSRMLRWILEADKKRKNGTLNEYRYNFYMKRIQKQIDKNIANGLELAKTHPEILLNYSDVGDRPKNERLQRLLTLVQILKPHLNVYLEVRDSDPSVLGSKIEFITKAGVIT